MAFFEMMPSEESAFFNVREVLPDGSDRLVARFYRRDDAESFCFAMNTAGEIQRQRDIFLEGLRDIVSDIRASGIDCRDMAERTILKGRKR